MVVVMVVAAYAAVFFLDILPALRARNWKALVPGSLILALGLAVQLLYESKVKLPAPGTALGDFLSNLFALK